MGNHMITQTFQEPILMGFTWKLHLRGASFRPHVYGKVGISRAKMFEMVGNFVTSVIYIKRYFKQMYLYCILNVKGLMA